MAAANDLSPGDFVSMNGTDVEMVVASYWQPGVQTLLVLVPIPGDMPTTQSVPDGQDVTVLSRA